MGAVRKLEPLLLDYLDNKLAANPVAKGAIANKLPRVLLMEAARATIGIREQGGNNDGYYVRLIQETVGTAHREAWCMSLMQSLIGYVEVNLNVVSPVVVSEHCLTVWKETPHAQRVIHYPMPGAIIIWQHGKSQNGHTGLYLESFPSDDPLHNNMITIEGNATKGLKPDGTIERNGGGVYMCERSMKGNGDMHVLGFLKPF